MDVGVKARVSGLGKLRKHPLLAWILFRGLRLRVHGVLEFQG